MAADSGDPRGYVQADQEVDEGAAIEEEYCNSDSDDDDVDRYVFLARQPAPAEASDDDDAMPVGGGGGGGGGPKRHLRDREILDAPPPPSKKDRLGLTGPHGAGPEESGSEEAVRFRGEGRGGDQAKTTNKKRGQREPLAVQGRGVRGKMKKSRIRSSGEDCREAAPVLQKKSFLCNVCGRCFGSHQALGGHVHFGHRKTAKINAASLHDDVAGGNSYLDEKVAIAMVEAAVSHEDADGAARSEENTAVAASGGESDPDGDGKKSVPVGACRQGVDSSSGRLRRNDGSSNGMGMNNGAANNYHGDHGDGGESNVGQEKVTVATSHNGGNATERKVAAVGRCHESTNGKANSCVVRKTRHRCEVCGKECLSGQALGGHMRKHRKRSPEVDGTPVLV